MENKKHQEIDLKLWKARIEAAHSYLLNELTTNPSWEQTLRIKSASHSYQRECEKFLVACDEQKIYRGVQ